MEYGHRSDLRLAAEKGVISFAEASRKYGISDRKIRKDIRAGILPTCLWRGVVMLRERDVQEYLEPKSLPPGTLKVGT